MLDLYNAFPSGKVLILHVSVFILELIALIIYEKLNARRIKSSFNKFIQQIKAGKFNENPNDLIENYDFVNIKSIQTELSELVGKMAADYSEQKKYIERATRIDWLGALFDHDWRHRSGA